MSEKRYYWLKLPKDYFKRHDIKFIKTLPNGRDIAFFYIELMAESVDHDGELRFSPEIPYSNEMLAAVTETPIEIVEAGMKTLKDLGLVEISEEGTIVLPKVVKMIGSASDTDEARRQRRCRERKKAECDKMSHDSVTSVTDAVTNDNESKSKSKSKSKSIERNTKEICDDVEIISEEEKMFNEFWERYPKKVDKKGSFRAFKNIPKLKTVFPSIMQALEVQRQSEQWTKNNGQFIPNPQTYIHQERWLSVNEADTMQQFQDQLTMSGLSNFNMWGEAN